MGLPAEPGLHRRDTGDAGDPAERLTARAFPGQPALAPRAPAARIVIASLALGGAERIVVDGLADQVRRGLRPGLAVLHSSPREWPLPAGVDVLRRPAGEGRAAFLGRIAPWLAEAGPVEAHLLDDPCLATLSGLGIPVLPVVHNTAAGWRADPSRWRPPSVPRVIAVAARVAEELREAGCGAPISVVRHRPRRGAAPDAAAREAMRRRLGVAPGEMLVGMAGRFKPQKDHPRAMAVLAALLASRPARLLILGGWEAEAECAEWRATCRRGADLGLAGRVRMPGFVHPVQPWLAACDAFLNLSRHEGLSMAVREALDLGLPVVATAVGGQEEIGEPGLSLLPPGAPDADFAARLAAAVDAPPRSTGPAPRSLASERLYRVAAAGARWSPSRDGPALFATANLNAGGAQRSLVNLARTLAVQGRAVAVRVGGESTHPHFPAALAAAGVDLRRLAEDRDALVQAEALLAEAARLGAACLCFWNCDPRVKLLVSCFAPPAARLVDVSPGHDSFLEMAGTGDFQEAIAWSAADWWRRLDRLVLKYPVPAADLPPEVTGRVRVVPNGVPMVPSASPASVAPAAAGGVRRIVVQGRLAPSKKLDVILAAMEAVWQSMADAELHVFGQAEPRHAAVAAMVTDAAARASGRIRLHGADPGLPERLGAFDLAVVLGRHQGCPNAVLEAMAAGLPVIANDSGGTGQLVRDGRTGRLLPEDADATMLAAVIADALADPGRLAAWGAAGRERAATGFSMAGMAEAYSDILWES